VLILQLGKTAMRFWDGSASAPHERERRHCYSRRMFGEFRKSSISGPGPIHVGDPPCLDLPGRRPEASAIT